MSDFQLIVGVDKTLSYNQMLTDINQIISDVEANARKIKVEFDFGQSEKAASSIKNALRDVGTSAKGAKASFVDQTTAISQIDAKISMIRTNLNKWTAAEHGQSASAYQNYKKQISSLETLRVKINQSGMTTREFNSSMRGINAELSKNQNVMASMGETTRRFGDRIRGLASKFSTWFGIYNIVTMLYRNIRKMITTVVDLDTAMTELKKVTDESDATYNKFLENATRRAKTLGASIKDVVSASADFARLGYSIEEAEKLSDAAIIYKNVGDGIDDINDASESIIATMQAYGIEAEDVMSIVDKFNKVGNEFAISSGGVGDALLRSAAAMRSAGNTIDETIALAAAANTVVQDPDKVGTTLKTVSMYLRAAKTEAEDAGESTDGMASSVSELRSEIAALTGGRVDIQIDENTFKSTYQILRELSQVWASLTDVTQANILELVGGKRNSNVVAALLENFSVAEASLEASSESAGSAMKENEKYLESAAGRLSLFKSEFEDFSQSLFDSELIKWIIDAGAGILGFANNLTESMGLFGIALSGIAMYTNNKLGILGLGKDGVLGLNTKGFFGNKGYTADENTAAFFELSNAEGLDSKQMLEFAEGTEVATKDMKNFLNTTQKGGHTLENFEKYMTSGTSRLKSFGKTASKVAQSVALSVAIMNAMRAGSFIISSVKDKINENNTSAIKEFTEVSSQLSSAESELSGLESELNNVESQIDALLSKDELTFADQEELSRLRNISSELETQIALTETLKKNLQDSLNSKAIDAYKEYTSGTAFYNDKTKEELSEEASESFSGIGNIIGLLAGGAVGFGTLNPVAGVTIGTAVGSSIGSGLGGLLGSAYGNASYDSKMTVEEAIKNMRVERGKLEVAKEEAYRAYSDKPTTISEDEWMEASDALTNFDSTMAEHISTLQEYYNAVDYSTLATDEAKEEYRKVGDMLASYSILSGTSGSEEAAIALVFDEKQITEDAKSLRDTILSMLEVDEDIHYYDIDSSMFAETTTRFNDMGIGLEKVISYLKGVKTEAVEAENSVGRMSSEDLTDKVSTFAEGVKALADAFKEFNEEGILAAGTIANLQKIFGDTGDAWTSFVNAMLSGSTTTTKAVELFEGLAQGELKNLLDSGGFKLYKFDQDMQKWILDTETGGQADQYANFIAQLELLNVKNAKQYVDRAQEISAINQALSRLEKEKAEYETLVQKKNNPSKSVNSLAPEELERYNYLKNRVENDSVYFEEAESEYGVKISDAGLVQQKKRLNEAEDLLSKYSDLESRAGAVQTAFYDSLDLWDENSTNRANLSELYNEFYELKSKGYVGRNDLPYSINDLPEFAIEGVKDIFADNTKFQRADEVTKTIDELERQEEDARAIRRGQFLELVGIARNASIDIEDIDISSFDPDQAGDNSIFKQVYDRVSAELSNLQESTEADITSLNDAIKESENSIGLDLKMDFDLDTAAIEEIKSSYDLMINAEKEMAESGQVSVDTINAMKEETDDYANYLYVENGLIKLNTEAWKKRADQSIGDKIDAIKSEMDGLDGANGALDKYAAKFEEVSNRFNRATNGNIDYLLRPVVSADKMKEYYPEFDGDIATTYSQTHTIGEGDFKYTVNITPILENGNVLTEDELVKYVSGLVTTDGVEGLLASDKNNLVIHVQEGDYDKKYWDEYEQTLSEVKNEHAELISEMESGEGISYAELQNYIKEHQIYGEELQIITSILNEYNQELIRAQNAQSEFVKTMSTFQYHSGGFDILDAIYSDITDGEAFDWSSILNNEQFATVFGGLGDAYTGFIHTISNNSGDISSCQEAFDELVSTWLDSTGVLSGITDDTKEASLAYLEQMGVANAADIVNMALARNKEYLALATNELVDATYEEVYAMYQAEEAGTAACRDLAEIAANKLLIANNRILTTSEVGQLINLANSANATSASIERLMKVKTLLTKAESASSIAASLNPGVIGQEWDEDIAQKQDKYIRETVELYTEAKSLLSQDLEYTRLDFSDIQISYSGGEHTKQEYERQKKEKETEKEKEKEETWFEKQYKLHQHLVAMEQETDKDYFSWLNKAYKQAYSEGILELDDYRKYQEEVFNGLREVFQDSLSDTEHEISMRQNYDGESSKIISLYQKLMKDVEKELSSARSQGLTNTDDYVQELQSKWQEYSQNIKDLRDEATEGAKSSIDELVEYRIDMIKQDIEDERDALDKKLDNLKEFYDKQKEMLRDQYDEEEYLEEQSEKRKAVSDIQAELSMLERDDSAWAQKRRFELQEELSEAQKDLEDFEEDKAFDVTLDVLDKAYESQKTKIQEEMDALSEKLNDPEALYNKALAEIKNNTKNLYREMLLYNRKHGTGNDDDVTDIYEEAYKILLEYKDIYGKNYEGIVLPNSTNYKSDTGSWNSQTVATNSKTTSGSSTSNSKTTSSTSGQKNTTKSYPYGKASETTGNIQRGAKGTGVKAIQYALNQLGYGNSGTKDHDGDFGDRTHTAVESFQKAMGIEVDGVVGTETRAKFKSKGYASGTRSATEGLHRVDELGAEYLFLSRDGNRYRFFDEGDKVLNANATDFLFDFANNGRNLLKGIMSGIGSASADKIQPIQNNTEIHMGDIVINGNASEPTVSEIRRAQRDSLSGMLRSLNKLNK